MKKLARFLKGYIKESILGPLFKLFEASLELIVPLIIAAIIDNGINAPGGSDKAYINKMCLLLVALAAIGLAFSVTAQYFAAKAACGFCSKMKFSLFSHIQTLSYTELDSIGSSTLITRITNDANQVQNGINLTLRLLLRSPFVVFGAMIMAFTIDVKSALNFAIIIPILSVVIFGIMLISIPFYKKVQRGVDSITLKTRENLNGARVIRSFLREKEEINDFREKNERLSDTQKFVGKISALMNPVTYVLINFAIIFLIYTGALQVNSGDLTQGQVVALYNYMSQILVELIKLANMIISLTKAIASGGRIQSVFDVNCSMVYGDVSLENIDSGITFENVCMKYSGSAEESLSNLSFVANAGETIGIIGGTGSGKTTLINLIPRFYDATDGSIKINGMPISSFTKESLREKIGVVPQKAVLFSGSIRDNMRWGNSNATDEEIMNAIEIAEAASIVNEKGGLDARIEENGRNLSGGQRQRLTIARALVKRPDILILDDSASALDYATDAALRRNIEKSQTNTTVFIVSQRASSVMHADKIIVLDDGEVIGQGTHDELIVSCSLYKEIYETQFGGIDDEK